MGLTGQNDRKKLIAALKRSLTTKNDPAYLKDLASCLFSNASLEDVQGYTTAENAGFVRSAGTLIARRKPGTHLVRVSNPAPKDGQSRHITLVEILNDNMPFLVDSIVAELDAFDVDILSIVHPLIDVKRDRAGRLNRLAAASSSAPVAGLRESLIQIHITRLADAADRDRLASQLDSLLTEIRLAVTDWRAMRARVEQAIDDYRFGAVGFADDDRDEAIAFLAWLLDDNFTLLGIREYDFVGGKTRGELKRRKNSGLGILRNPKIRVLRQGGKAYTTTPATRAFLMQPEPLFVTKANVKSRVHRRAYMDYIGIKLHHESGKLAGELRVIGLFTSTAYTQSTRVIPHLRRKIDSVLGLAGFDPDGHSGKALVNVLESYPRDELFHIDDERLYEFSVAILELFERPRIRVLVRPDEFGRYVSAIVFVPRDRYDSDVRLRIGEYLADQFDGHVSAFFPTYLEATAMVRVHFIIGRDEGKAPDFVAAELETGVARIVRTWADTLRHRISDDAVPEALRQAGRPYLEAFPASYRDRFDPDVAIADLELFDRLTDDRPLALAFHKAGGGDDHELGLKLYHLRTPLSLSERVPILENMGFRVIAEQTFAIKPVADAEPVYIHDMSLERADGGTVDLKDLNTPLSDCLSAVWYGEAENDGYNSLVLVAGLVWRDVALIRALGRYLHQAGTPYSQRSMWEAFRRYPAIARSIVALFAARFDPDAVSERTARRIERSIMSALEDVESLDDDRVVRRFVNLLDAMLRTNFFQQDSDGAAKSEIVFKFASRDIDTLPEPRPFREIYVYSPRVEGVHLRFGMVARGGLRWSDRAQDFRTEVLGLVKAQQVKNAVIVPVGAKGGFVAKWLRPGNTREEFLAEGQAAYRLFVSSLLDITDNLDGEAIVPPERVVRRDDDDPYLVVAADKGTATFSDIANGIAVDKGFWLGDAFASGGSAGYDHKKMGITARGAWEAVKRHFREMDTDIQTTPFTAIGVGDMSGDVFGNGMLLSKATRLVAAFDHRDIFIDPDPDPKTSFAERKRLFDTPRTSWQDYDRKLISKGGGVFSRREKSISLSPQIRAALDIAESSVTPQALMRAILLAPADLLWFGGIGTYVKEAAERDEDVGDRANDPIRVSADELRVRVIGEGANLGLTQRARIAFGMAGGRCNSDAIDNSAGVNTSDVEVNIKIALGQAVREGRMTLPQRNKLLKAMTDNVAELVLDNNYAQTLAISLTERQGMEDFGFQHRLMQSLERRDLLDRSVEFLPDDAAMAERQAAGQPLTRAEIGVLLAYTKITLFDDLMATGLADDPSFVNELMRYFPTRMRSGFTGEIEGHRLRRDIVVTSLSNFLVNRCGPTFVMRVMDRTGVTPDVIARAYVAAREAFSLRAFNGQIDKLDNRIAGSTQLALYQEAQDLVHGRTVWFLENVGFDEGLGAVIERFHDAVKQVEAGLDGILPERLAARIERRSGRLVEDGVPKDMASAVARLPVLADALDICVAAEASNSALLPTGSVFFEVGERFQISRMQELASALSVTDYYDGLALDRALETLGAIHRRLTESVLATGKDAGAVSAWLKAAGVAGERTLDAITAMTESEELTVSRVSVAAGLLLDFCRERDRRRR